eukprot:TRINITY_DN49_c0_g1_i7.p1 TRINITY_DN49_c0_g1~~TRINITY_DN49_c0_g1_i7.p1  ORF type:complete len:201 (+),score=40.80 TRINITY_DN49_c0_g1_i7:212-814(+)
MDKLDGYIATRPSLGGTVGQKELQSLQAQVERGKISEVECTKLRERVRNLESSEQSSAKLLEELYKTLSILRQALCGGLDDGGLGEIFDMNVMKEDQGEGENDIESSQSTDRAPAFVLKPGNKSRASLKKFKEYLDHDVFELTKLAHRKMKERSAEHAYFHKTRRRRKKISFSDLAAEKERVHLSLKHSLKDMRQDAAKK